MDINVFGVSDVGMRREKNEDSYLINKELDLFVVADGMGGHVGGEYASQLAVKTIEDSIYKFAGNSHTITSKDGEAEQEDYRAQLRHSIKTASHNIYEEAKKDLSLKGMGTTAVVLLARDERVLIANVGDSRGYLIRNNEIIQLTEDHSLVGEQLRAGVISEHMAKEHKLKNIITRSVGFQEDVEIDVLVKVPRENDVFLLCSDGLTNMLEDKDLLEVVKNNDINEACQILVDMANTRGGDDNITVVLAKTTNVSEPVDEDDESTIGI